MTYRSLRQCVDDLARHGHLVRVEEEVDGRLEAAEIQRRVYRAGGPAVLFERVKGCTFPMVSTLFGTIERARFIFRDTYEQVRRVIELKIDRQWKVVCPACPAACPAYRGARGQRNIHRQRVVLTRLR